MKFTRSRVTPRALARSNAFARPVPGLVEEDLVVLEGDLHVARRVGGGGRNEQAGGGDGRDCEVLEVSSHVGVSNTRRPPGLRWQSGSLRKDPAKRPAGRRDTVPAGCDSLWMCCIKRGEGMLRGSWGFAGLLAVVACLVLGAGRRGQDGLALQAGPRARPVHEQHERHGGAGLRRGRRAARLAGAQAKVDCFYVYPTVSGQTA